MREDWELLKNEEEKRILQYHTDIGRLLASVYAGRSLENFYHQECDHQNVLYRICFYDDGYVCHGTSFAENCQQNY